MGLLLTLVLYFAPAIIAYLRGHKQREAIGVINLVLGWTMIGWVVCFAWSLLK